MHWFKAKVGVDVDKLINFKNSETKQSRQNPKR